MKTRNSPSAILLWTKFIELCRGHRNCTPAHCQLPSVPCTWNSSLPLHSSLWAPLRSSVPTHCWLTQEPQATCQDVLLMLWLNFYSLSEHKLYRSIPSFQYRLELEQEHSCLWLTWVQGYKQHRHLSTRPVLLPQWLGCEVRQVYVSRNNMRMWLSMQSLVITS